MKPLAAVREDLQVILSGKEYQIYQNKQNLLQDLFNRLKDWLYAILHRVFPQVDVAKTTADWLAYGITTLGAILVVFMLYLLLSRFVRQSQVTPQRMSIAQGLKMTVQHHLAEAQSLAEQGQYPAALRHLFLGFILYLDQNHWIEAKAWKTNWEYFAELKASAPQLANSFTALAVKFEEAMYGGRPIDRDEYWLYHNQVNGWIHKGDETT